MNKRKIEYKYNIGDVVNGTKSTYTIISRYQKYDNSGRKRKMYTCKCHKCNGETTHVEYDISNCAYCANKKVLTGFNDIATTHPNLVKYFENPEDAKSTYANASKVEISAKCPLCGNKRKIRPVALTLSGYLYCPKCSNTNSYPNRLALSVLKQLQVEYLETEYSPKWASKYRYDFSFWNKGKHYLLEMDGGYHYEERFCQLNKLKKRDEEKNILAKKNKCILIRIECKESSIEYIRKKIEKSMLNNIFDLSVIDWIKCENDCATNLTKAIAVYYNNTHSINQTAENFSICTSTVRTYLQRASKLGWTQYKTIYQRQQENITKAVKLKSENPDMSLTDIAKLLGVSNTTVTSYLTKAQELGLIKSTDDYFSLKKKKAFSILRENPDTSILQLSKKYEISNETLRKYKRELYESAAS